MPTHVVSFSGGKDSTAMLLMMIESGYPIDRIIFVDTTKEFPAMYSHITKVAALCPVPIETIKIDFDYWFSEHIKTRGKNKGKRGYGWPDFRNRWCTALKRDAVKRALKGVEDVIQYHGIAFDEQHRCIKNANNIVYPLVDMKITEKEALDYCYNHGFIWDGLYEKFNRVSCWCCPLSRLGELKTLRTDFPELWTELEQMDTKSYRQFRSDYSVTELVKKFNKGG